MKCIFDNKECLCPHGHLHNLKSRMEKYFPTLLYNDLKSILEYDWDTKKSYELNANKEHPPTLTNHYITDKSTNHNDFSTKLYQDMIQKMKQVQNMHELVIIVNKVYDNNHDSTYGVFLSL